VKCGRWAIAVLLIQACHGRLPAADNCIIQGAAKYVGAVPTTEPLKLSADPYCVKINAEQPLVRQDTIVNRNATLKNVIVYVKDGLPPGGNYPIPAEAAILDQRGCRYEPHVLALRVGQELRIVNSDKTIHNIHSQPKANDRFNFSMISDKVKPQVRKFTAPELPVPVKCDVHPWMQAWLGVFNHPFYAVSGDDGTFEISGLPPGSYTLAAWHEKLGVQETAVTIGAGETKPVEFTFRGSGSSAAAP
jgi:hypothetical protein